MEFLCERYAGTAKIGEVWWTAEDAACEEGYLFDVGVMKMNHSICLESTFQWFTAVSVYSNQLCNS